MKCMYCEGEMVRGSAPVHIERKDVCIRVDNVPAWVCAQCGQAYFEEAEVSALLPEDAPIVPSETACLSEAALAVDWNRPEEDEAWSLFQTV